MEVRDLIKNAAASNLKIFSQPVSHHLQAAAIIADHDPTPVLLQAVQGFRVAANLVTDRSAFAHALNLDNDQFLQSLSERLKSPPRIEHVSTGPCFEVTYNPPDLNLLPILHHFACDGGRYITSGVWIIHDPVLGRNLSFHRMMLLDARSGSVRVVEQRGMDVALKRIGPGAEVAICIGVPVNILLAAALSPASDIDEMMLAAALAEVQLAPCKIIKVEAPTLSEWVIETRLTDRKAVEGPFIDITGTIDFIREQPVFEVVAVSSRRDPVYHALLPAGSEHRALMGLPKELDIHRAVNEICPCIDVRMTTGGSSWLHAVIVIGNHERGDVARVIEAAFQAHKSLKHVVIVDDDIDPGNPNSVEWAIATRVQANRDIVIKENQPSSSLDPSAIHTPGQKSRGCKLGIDATIKTSHPDELNLFRKVKIDA